MARLKDRNRQIPGGLRFYVSQTKWQPPRFASFETIVQGLIAHRRANPFLSQQNGWSTDENVVRAEVDSFNAELCRANNWLDYIDPGGPPPPKLEAPRNLRQLVGRVAAGANSIGDMFGADGPITDVALAEARALKCSTCPKNEKGDWSRFFTIPASQVILTGLEYLKRRKLKTSLDDKLVVCSACSCPLKLKVWARLKHIVDHMPQESQDALVDDCWVRTEQMKK